MILLNGLGSDLKNTAFWNSWLFSLNLKMFGDNSSQIIRETAQITPQSVQIWFLFLILCFFWQWVYARGTWCHILLNCDVTANDLQKTPPKNIKRFGNDSQYVRETNRRNPVFWLFCDVFKHLMILEEPRWILECSLLQIVTRNIAEMMYCHRFTEIHSSSKEMQPP